jgi:hypothetical protein
VKSGSLVLLSIFGLFWSSIILMADFFAAREIAGQWRSRSFTETSGHVRSSTLTQHFGRHVTYTADLVYEYTVNGTAFTGSRLRYGGWTSSAGQARDMVDSHPAGSATAVFFDPANPSDAVLETGLDGGTLSLTLIFAPFNVIMLWIWSKVIAAARASKTAPVAGGMQIDESGLETRVRMPRMTAYAAGMLALGGLSFLAIFLLGFATNMNPSIRTVGAAWGGVLGASALIFARRWRRIQSGAEDLVIDEGARALTLPRTFGRKESITATIRDLKAVTVEKAERPARNGRVTYTWKPTLQFKDGRQAETLADWNSNEKAEAFTAWLRERIGLPAAS